MHDNCKSRLWCEKKYWCIFFSNLIYTNQDFNARFLFLWNSLKINVYLAGNVNLQTFHLQIKYILDFKIVNIRQLQILHYEYQVGEWMNSNNCQIFVVWLLDGIWVAIHVKNIKNLYYWNSVPPPCKNNNL